MRVGHYLVQSVPLTHGLAVLDIADAGKAVRMSQQKIDDGCRPHWTGWEPKTKRVVVTGYSDVHRLYLVKPDPSSGAPTMDTAFHDATANPDLTSTTGGGHAAGRVRRIRTGWFFPPGTEQPDRCPRPSRRG